MINIKCPRCANNKSWLIRRNKRKCAACKYEWSLQKLPLQISRSEWKHLIEHFLERETVTAIQNKMNLGRGQVLRAFGIIRTVMSRNSPIELTAISPGSQAPDKVFVGYFEKYSLKRRQKFTNRNPIASLDGVFALVCRNEKVWGKLISGQPGSELEAIMNESAGKTIPWSSILDRYIGVITKTRLYTFNYEGKSRGGVPDLVCYSLWVELKELIAAKHGVRSEGLPLYLAEIIWRNNFEKISELEQRKRILSLIEDSQHKIKDKAMSLDNRASFNDFRTD